MEVEMLSLSDILDFDDRAEAFYMLVEYYKSASDNERESIRDSWDFNREWTFPDQEVLAIDLPNERSCEERIQASLILDSITEDFRIDSRDTLVGFCPIYHSAIEVGLAPEKLFAEVAEISCSEFALLLQEFISRPDEGKSMKAFGWERIVESDGKIRFKRNW